MELRSHFRRHEILVWVVVVAFVATVPYGVINAFTQHRATTALDTWVDRAIPFTAEWEYVYAWFLLFAFLPVAVIRGVGAAVRRLSRRRADSGLELGRPADPAGQWSWPAGPGDVGAPGW